MRLYLVVVISALLLAACGGPKAPDASGTTPGAAPSAANPTAASSAAPTDSASNAGAAPSPVAPALAGRTRELVNPDANTMIFLYYDLSGIAPPIETWVEEDSRVKYAPGIEKAAKRTAVRAELSAAAAAVRGVGILHISLNSANLSEYDPAYSEFTVQALEASSEIPFAALGQKVDIKFGNSRAAQTWHVAPTEAQTIRDRVSGANVSLELTLRITDVLPGPGGGTITADVLEYEMRESRGGTTIASIKVVK